MGSLKPPAISIQNENWETKKVLYQSSSEASKALISTILTVSTAFLGATLFALDRLDTQNAFFIGLLTLGSLCLIIGICSSIYVLHSNLEAVNLALVEQWVESENLYKRANKITRIIRWISIAGVIFTALDLFSMVIFNGHAIKEADLMKDKPLNNPYSSKKAINPSALKPPSPILSPNQIKPQSPIVPPAK